MCNCWKSDRLIASIILSETMGEMVSQITGWSSVRIAQDDILWKPPLQAKTIVGFHQDSAYISDQFTHCENNSVTVWMALDDVTAEMGCLEYAPGSHLWRDIVSTWGYGSCVPVKIHNDGCQHFSSVFLFGGIFLSYLQPSDVSKFVTSRCRHMSGTNKSR